MRAKASSTRLKPRKIFRRRRVSTQKLSKTLKNQCIMMTSFAHSPARNRRHRARCWSATWMCHVTSCLAEVIGCVSSAQTTRPSMETVICETYARSGDSHAKAHGVGLPLVVLNNESSPPPPPPPLGFIKGAGLRSHRTSWRSSNAECSDSASWACIYHETPALPPDPRRERLDRAQTLLRLRAGSISVCLHPTSRFASFFVEIVPSPPSCPSNHL